MFQFEQSNCGSGVQCTHVACDAVHRKQLINTIFCAFRSYIQTLSHTNIAVLASSKQQNSSFFSMQLKHICLNRQNVVLFCYLSNFIAATQSSTKNCFKYFFCSLICLLLLLMKTCECFFADILFIKYAAKVNQHPNQMRTEARTIYRVTFDARKKHFSFSYSSLSPSLLLVPKKFMLTFEIPTFDQLIQCFG